MDPNTPLDHYFTWVDWAVVFGYLGLTTLVGHLMSGKQSSIKDFFLGGRSLPWPAVSGSIIATEISGVTFIGVPGTLFAISGDFTYLQWAIGSILARVVVGMVFVKVFYERDIYSPYDYMGNRLGGAVKNLATVFFTIGSILAQSVRVLVAALPLLVITEFPFWVCILIIGIFAIAWTLMGGMQTVIWTDVMQFVLFTVGGSIALFWISTEIGWGNLIETAGNAGKFQTFDFRFEKELQFTFWVAIFAVPFLNLNAYGVDQLNAQRMFCCKNANDATKAIIFSSVGQLLTILMLMVGAALWVYYLQHPPTGEIAAGMGYNPDNNSVAKGDMVFPIWIVTELPMGLKGLILAGVFAAAISSLDSILAALSQTTLSLIHKPEKGHAHLDDSKLVMQSRILVVIWGLILVGFTFLLEVAREDIPILPLAFGMTAYTAGPMLAMFICALLRKGSFIGLCIGAIISFAITMLVRTDVAVLVGYVMQLGDPDIDSAKILADLTPTFELSDSGGLKSVYSYVWMWPISFFITLGFGLLIPGKNKGDED